MSDDTPAWGIRFEGAAETIRGTSPDIRPIVDRDGNRIHLTTNPACVGPGVVLAGSKDVLEWDDDRRVWVFTPTTREG